MKTTQASTYALILVYLHFLWYRFRQFTEHGTAMASTPASYLVESMSELQL
jgi:hypothetical protein